jgi:hypothetical protein
MAPILAPMNEQTDLGLWKQVGDVSPGDHPEAILEMQFHCSTMSNIQNL